MRLYTPRSLAIAAALLAATACTRPATTAGTATSPAPDPRVGLKAGLMDAGEAVRNMRVLAKAPAPPEFLGKVNSDLAFKGNYVIQGSFNGWQIWDIANPSSPRLATAFVCPASQSDVSVYGNLLIVSGEDLAARLDCGTQGVKDTVSTDRLRGVRIFDISDITRPRNVGNVQTCRGSHTHTLLVDPKDRENVYVYISGSGPVRSPTELAGCVGAMPDEDPNSALFRIEVIKVPLAHPEQARIVSSPRIFAGLTRPAAHGEAEADVIEARNEAAAARARGEYTATIQGVERVAPNWFVQPLLDSIVKARGGTGAATKADSTALRNAFQRIVDRVVAAETGGTHGPTQCHDITVYPAIGLAGGACEGYGMLLDISDPVNPKRISAAADSNFSYWHSATFNNDGSKILFSDEWGGGGSAKCRATDRREWGADAIFTIANRRDLQFRSYYKLPAPQTALENCVAHNGSMIPIPERDIMVQAWYQGGISVFEFTDPSNPREIAFFDRGPIDATRPTMGGSWSVYWYNGVIVSSEIARGLDVLELTPSAFLTQNEIDAAKTVRFDYLNAQGQPRFVWPASFPLALAYVDQLERSRGLSSARIAAARATLSDATMNRQALAQLASQLEGDAAGSSDGAKVRLLASTVRELAR
ncbi:MAG TPA: hypothetical protein VHM67_13905 [Gemmatimonadaceae bacterium]|nr:hypothetical protein [Gemmatimonadaceae bacterium]